MVILEAHMSQRVSAGSSKSKEAKISSNFGTILVIIKTRIPMEKHKTEIG